MKRILFILSLFLMALSAFGQPIQRTGYTTNAFPAGTAEGALVGLGVGNTNTGMNGVVAGGSNNFNASIAGVIGGGTWNRITGTSNEARQITIVGGESNFVHGASAHAVVGNFINLVENARYGVCLGWEGYLGHATLVTSNNAILSGWENTNESPNSVIAGGYFNRMFSQPGQSEINHYFQSGNFIGAGFQNLMTNCQYSAIVAGDRCEITNILNNFIQGAFIGAGIQHYVGADYGAIVAGLNNHISSAGDYSFMGCGSISTISGGHCSIVSGLSCTIAAGVDYSFIGAGAENAITAGNFDYCSIPGGFRNRISATKAHVLGNEVTNTTADSVEIGTHNTGKTRFTPTGFVTLGSAATSPATVALTADNQAVTTSGRSYIRLTSDAVAASRTFTLAAGIEGQILYIEFSGANGAELADTGTQKLTAIWTATADDTIHLISNGTDWLELGRAAN